MTMKNLKSVLLICMALTLLSPGALFANTDSSMDKESAKVIFVRGPETSQTRNLKYNVYIGQQYVGRMKANDSREIELPSGNYQVQTNFPKGSSLRVSLKPGKTYVISTALEKTTNSKKTHFKLLSENIASSEEAVINTDS